MGRLFSCVLLSLMLLPAARQSSCAQPAFFSMLFPQLVPGTQAETSAEATEGEAVRL